MFNRLRSIIAALFRRSRFEAVMREEMRSHLEFHVADLIRSGVPPGEAVRQARLAFGNLESVKDDCRQARGLWLFDELRRNIRYAARRLRQSPAFALTACATLALTLGANLTIFAVIDGILLRPLPFPHADRLVRVFNSYPRAGVPDDGTSVTNYYERRGRLGAFSSLAVIRESTAIVGDVGATERQPIALVTSEFFATLGVPLAMGRAFEESEMSSQASRAAIVTDAYWRQQMNADPGALGRTIRVNGFDHAVVGVLPATFRFLSSKARVYFPLTSSPEDRGPDRRHSGSSSHMIARLQPGATIAEAQAQIDAHNAAMEVGHPQAAMMAEAGFHTPVVPLQTDHVASIQPVLVLVQAGAILLLLIGVVNLANLLLVSVSARSRELAVRQALGASRRRLAIELLIEVAMLTFAGAALGLALGAAGARLLPVLGVDHLPLGAQISFDSRVAAVAFASALAVALVLATPIALHAVRLQAASSLPLASRGGTASRAAQRLRHGFVVAQVALSFVLLSGAGLLGLSLRHAMAVSPGFDTGQVTTGHVTLPGRSYPRGASILLFTARLTDELSRQPGVTAVAIATNVPLSGNNIKSAATVKGYVPPAGDSLHGHFSYGVSGDYFHAMGVTLVEGRFLSTVDSERSERVCVVDDVFARRYWPGRSAIGEALFQGGTAGSDADAFRVVGVVGAVTQIDVTDGGGQGAVYYPLAYRLDRNVFVVVRTNGSAEVLAATLRAAVRDDRSRAPGQRHPVDASPRCREPCGSPHSGARDNGLFHPCRAPHRHWHVRRLELRSLSAAPRNWPTDGPRRETSASPGSVPVNRTAPARRGHGDRYPRRVVSGPHRPDHALPSVRNPRPNIGCGHRASHRSVLLRLPDSFAPSGVHHTD